MKLADKNPQFLWFYIWLLLRDTVLRTTTAKTR